MVMRTSGKTGSYDSEESVKTNLNVLRGVYVSIPKSIVEAIWRDNSQMPDDIAHPTVDIKQFKMLCVV